MYTFQNLASVLTKYKITENYKNHLHWVKPESIMVNHLHWNSDSKSFSMPQRPKILTDNLIVLVIFKSD